MVSLVPTFSKASSIIQGIQWLHESKTHVANTHRQSLRVAPPSAHPNTTTNLTTHCTDSTTAPSAPGLADTLRSTLTPAVPDASNPPPSSSHPLEARLLAWKKTQNELKMHGLRRTYGIAEPVRREMELKDVRAGDTIGASFLRGKDTSVGEDILGGRDTEIGGWEGVFGTGECLSIAIANEVQG